MTSTITCEVCNNFKVPVDECRWKSLVFFLIFLMLQETMASKFITNKPHCVTFSEFRNYRGQFLRYLWTVFDLQYLANLDLISSKLTQNFIKSLSLSVLRGDLHTTLDSS